MSAPAWPLAMTARRPRPPERLLLSRRLRSRLRERTGRPTGPRTAEARPHPTRPPTALPAFPGARLTERRAGCRRLRPHPRPGPVRAATRRLRGPPAVQGLRGFRDLRGPRLPRRTSEVRGPARPALQPRGPLSPGALPGPGGLRVLGGLRVSVPQAPVLAPTSRATPREHPGPLGPGHPLLGLRDQVRPGRVRPGRVDRARVPVVARVPVHGRATTRSARPPLAWARRLRLGLRRQPGPASRVHLAARDSRPVPPVPPAVPAVLPVLVLRDVDRVGPAARPRAGSQVRVPADRVLADPGRAR
jgi:hypothetical protein